MTAMIKLRHQQPSLWHRGLAEDIEGLWEPWMRLVDQLLEDEQLLDTVYEAQGERHPQSRSRGRMQTPAEVLLYRARWLPMRGFIRARMKKAGQVLGVQWISVPNKKTTSGERNLLQRQRWFRNGQKWRT